MFDISVDFQNGFNFLFAQNIGQCLWTFGPVDQPNVQFSLLPVLKKQFHRIDYLILEGGGVPPFNDIFLVEFFKILQVDFPNGFDVLFPADYADLRGWDLRRSA